MDLRVRLVLGAVAVAGTVAALQAWGAHREAVGFQLGIPQGFKAGRLEGFTAGKAQVRADLLQASADASEQARLTNRDNAARAARIDTHALETQRTAAAVAASAAADGNGMRLTFAAHRGEPTAGPAAGQCSAERAYSRRLEDLLDASSRLVEESTGIVGEAVALIDGLQAREALEAAR